MYSVEKLPTMYSFGMSRNLQGFDNSKQNKAGTVLYRCTYTVEVSQVQPHVMDIVLYVMVLTINSTLLISMLTRPLHSDDRLERQGLQVNSFMVVQSLNTFQFAGVQFF